MSKDECFLSRWEVKGNPSACQQSCELSQGDTSFAHPQKVQTRPRAPPAHPSLQPSVPRVAAGPVLAVSTPGAWKTSRRGDPGSKTNADGAHYGGCQESLPTDCSNLVPSFLDFPARGGPHLIQSLDLSQMHMTGWLSQMERKPVLRAGGDLKWTWQPGRPAAPPNAGEPAGPPKHFCLHSRVQGLLASHTC